MKIKFLLIILTFFYNFCYSQDNIKKQKAIDSMIMVVQDKGIYATKGSKEVLRICTEIYYQSKEIDYGKGMIQADLKMSEVYLNEQNYKAALEKILQGKSLAKEFEDNYSLAVCFIQEAAVYSELGYIKKSDKALDNALRLVHQIPLKETYLLKALINRTKAQNFQRSSVGVKDSALIYLYKGQEDIKKLDNKNPYKFFFMGIFATDLAEEYYRRNDFLKSEMHLNEFHKVMFKEKDQSNFIHYYILKGNIENKKKDYLQALEYFDKALGLNQKYRIYTLSLRDIYSGKAQSYLGLNDYKNQAIYSAKAKKITDSITIADQKLLNIAIDINEGDDPFIDKENKNYNYLIACTFIVLAGLIFYIFRYKIPHDHRSTKVSPEVNSSELQLKPFSPLQNEKSETEIESLRTLIQLAKNDDKAFLLKFSEVFPSFNQKLININPQLTHSDLEYCALIKLKFDTKEIARYKKVTINSVISKKYRIRKKLNISTDENMYTWMLNTL
ncbi:hypothetical protein EU348_02850 [Chryseobacterium indologenes]|uniref:Uncharacterized protein n=1 Tax=Chryseobacterium indologenes TaxID=253 RepID=A0A411DIG1_CHRID|nr:hypothetical protein EU348_02850 [Chryseobacterium indologenes]